MFALCHFKDEENSFILCDKKDLKEVVGQMDIEIEKELTLDEMEKDYSLYPLLEMNDLIIRTMTKKIRTTTNRLDSLGISCWAKLKQEYEKVQEKKSRLSRSERELIVKHYEYILSL